MKKKVDTGKIPTITLKAVDKDKYKNRPKSNMSEIPETIVLKIPTSESDEKNENSESEETQKVDTTRVER